MGGRRNKRESHVVPDDYSQLHQTFSVEMINSKTRNDDDYLVPHHHPQLLATSDPNPEAEAAIVPSLSVCSNDVPCPNNNHQTLLLQEPHQQSLTNKLSISQSTPAKKKHTPRRITSAKLHNLSQRKQRDTIKRKMRQLQQLIPNCNKKVDKVSILDEAIAYLKALQLQLQMMLRGRGIMHPNGTLWPHLTYMITTPTFPMLGFAPAFTSSTPVVSPSAGFYHR